MLKSLLGLATGALGGIQGYLIAAAIAGLLASGATYYVVHNADTVKLQAVQLADSKAQTASVTASLDQLQGFIATMHTADADYNAVLVSLRGQFAALEQEFKNATAKPLPADCRPDAGRLRVLSAAVDAANKAASAGK